MAPFSPAQVRRFYDRQTRGFVALGQGGGAIHRAVWGPGVHDRDAAFHYVEDQIAGFIRGLADTADVPHVVDLGCGVGASLVYLAAHLPIRGTGITLSPVQASLAGARIAASGLSDRVTCLEGDYCHLPASLVRADLAYAIESFLHCTDPVRFFDECRRLIRKGGLLVICDDVLRSDDDPASARALARFREGWHANALLREPELRGLAERAGFEAEQTIDLSSWLEIRRGRDRAIDVFLALFGWLPLGRTPFAHLSGGSALQACLANGWVGYDLAVFRRRN